MVIISHSASGESSGAERAEPTGLERQEARVGGGGGPPPAQIYLQPTLDTTPLSAQILPEHTFCSDSLGLPYG